MDGYNSIFCTLVLAHIYVILSMYKAAKRGQKYCRSMSQLPLHKHSYHISRVISLDLREWMLNSINCARHRILFSVRSYFPLCPFTLTSMPCLSPPFLSTPSLLRPTLPGDALNSMPLGAAPVTFSPSRGPCVCVLKRDLRRKRKQRCVGTGKDAPQHTPGSGD